ncbi:metallophosphoesterase [Flavobacterium sp. P21]|uniref:metallophosphoesterase n=1 Tax=Flavobacterium sp. P21 TaxID=3423948 RepID=UPI003D66C1F9
MKKIFILNLVAGLLFATCATFKSQSRDVSSQEVNKKLSQSIYLTGGYGLVEDSIYLRQFRNILKEAPENSTLLFLGDNISEQKKDSLFDKKTIEQQITTVGSFKGKTYFIPGDFEWKYNDSRKANFTQEILKNTGNKSFQRQPKNGSPLSSISVNKDLEIIFIDSQWYISDWDDVKYINENSPDIKTRRRFLEELESMIRDLAFKNVIIAMHHPIFSNGKHGGKYSFNDYLHPLPIIGFGDKAVRKLGGEQSKGS